MTMQYDENTYLLFFFRGDPDDGYTSGGVVSVREVSLSEIPAEAHAYQFCKKKYVPGRGWKRVDKSPMVFINAKPIEGEEIIALSNTEDRRFAKLLKEWADDDERRFFRTRAGHVVLGHENDLIIHI